MVACFKICGAVCCVLYSACVKTLNQAAVSKISWSERLPESWWQDSYSCIGSVWQTSLCKHQVLWTWLWCCWISKFWLAAQNWAENKSCSSSGSAHEELVTLAIVSVFHNSGNFMGYFSLSLSKINVLLKNKERNHRLSGRHTVWTWGTSGWRGSLQNAPFSWELMLQHSDFIYMDLFYISGFGIPHF